MLQQRSRRQVCSVLAMAGLSGCLNFTATDEQASSSTPRSDTPQGTPNGESTSVSQSATTDQPRSDGWPYSLPAPVTTTPLIDESTVYFGCMDHKLYGVNVETGTQQFATDVGDQVGPGLTLSGGVIYGSTPAGLFGVDATSGDLTLSASNRAVGFGIREPLVADGILYYPAGGTLLAIDVTSGEVVWSRRAPAAWGGKPALVDSTLIVSDAGDVSTTPSDQSRVFGLDPTDGSTRWQVSISADSLVSSVAASAEDQTAVLVGRYGLTAAFDTNTGEERWRATVDRNGNVTGRPAIAEQTVVVPLGGNGLFAYDLNSGSERWGKPEARSLSGYAVTIANGQVLTGSEAATLLDLETGDQIRQFELTPPLADSVQPTMSEHALIYPAADTTLQRRSL
ncbi:PQQ-binding-like beta-propeller repeat protein [Halobaculum limi]|uniref:PQQ-binding-like beta-propeller repeat protein n=1 Tax=Halobaculum limi TaxID=3031916 RepID=UPI002AA2B340|nr:PQQ-binding-like beta-propeller repeat protein [Halobaculum sp. YSMS11]